MKAKELRQKTKEELKKEIEEKKLKLQSLRFDLAGGKLKNIREIRFIKKDIAKILTILRDESFKK